MGKTIETKSKVQMINLEKIYELEKKEDKQKDFNDKSSISRKNILILEALNETLKWQVLFLKIFLILYLSRFIEYCERRYFRAVHIFVLFAFMKCPRKYVNREINFYNVTYRQQYQKRGYISARNCQFSEMRENLYTRKYLHSQ